MKNAFILSKASDQSEKDMRSEGDIIKECKDCLFGEHPKNTMPGPCIKCMNEPNRPNFASMYREEDKKTPKKVKNKTIMPGRDRSEKEFPSKKIRTRSDPQKEKKLFLEPKKEETPKPDPTIKKEKIYKILYRDLNTGDWFFELNTKDRIGHHIGLVAEILDTI